MAIEDILRAMEADAEAEREAILLAARQEAEQVLARAREDAERTRTRRVEAELRGLRSEQARQLNDARLAGLRAVAAARERLLTTTFSEAAIKLSSVREWPDYPAIFQRLYEEAVAELSEDNLTLRVDPRDHDLARSLAHRPDTTVGIEPALSCLGGVEVAANAGRVVVLNTIEHRLARAKETMREELLELVSVAAAGPPSQAR